MDIVTASACPPERVIAFGPFLLFPTKRLLLDGDQPLRMGSRALDILIALAERPGEVVSKAELMARVWPRLHVEENNLRVHMSALRRAIGDGSGGHRYVVSIPNQGYVFVAPVEARTIDAPIWPAKFDSPHNLPILLTRLVGRQSAIEILVGHLRRHRLLTIVGSGGVGKTSVALAAAERVMNDYSDGIWFADLAPISHSKLVASTVAAVLGLEAKDDNVMPNLVRSLRACQLLVVLDNCEHVIEGAAELADQIMRHAPHVRILATSREPLRIEGENVHRLSPLECPDAANTSGQAARAYSAIQLFIERATASMTSLEFGEREMNAVVEICRKLDGIPLAIEFAAAYAGALGVEGLARHLDDGLKLLSAHRNGAPERHQTLRATQDWSYALLTDTERLILRRLSIFAGNFTLESASAVAGDRTPGSPDVVNEVTNLISKSLVAAEVTALGPRYRLLDTTRAFAREKLNAAGEFADVARRVATYFADHLNDGWTDKDRLFADGVYKALTDQVGTLRTALQWCFSPEGDPLLGAELAAGVSICFTRLGLTAEAQDWSARGLAALTPDERGGQIEAVLQLSFARALMVTSGNSEEAREAILRSIELCGAIGDREMEFTMLSTYHIFVGRAGDITAAMAIAHRANEIAMDLDDADALGMANAMLCQSHHNIGDQAKAEIHHLAALRYAPLSRRINQYKVGVDQRFRSMGVNARILFLLGRPEQAEAHARASVENSVNSPNPTNILLTVMFAATIAIMMGNWTWAQETISLLGDTGRRLSMEPFPILADALQAELAFRTGDRSESALAAQEATFEGVLRSRYNPGFHAMGVIEALTLAGRQPDAQAHLDRMISKMEREGMYLFMPEYYRLDGDILAATGNSEGAREAYGRAVEMARTQSTLAWELRAAMGLARLDQTRNPKTARAALQPVYDRFKEGRESADLQAARGLLEALA
jgi:predicted ATPase/DNA-binding winged helix-turn-helix (wHTH) protein